MKRKLFFVSLLACISALAEDNTINWRNGRPGVRVVTNAPSRAELTAVSNLFASVADSVSAPTVGTMIANAVGPLLATNGVGDNVQVLWGYPFADYTSLSFALTSIKTSAYTAQQGVNNHAGNTSNPHGTTAEQLGAVSNEQLAEAIAAIKQNDPYIVIDSTDTNRWWRFEGTQAVQYALVAAATTYTVALSTNFMETEGGTYPEWTTTNWPFHDGDWHGSTAVGGEYASIVNYSNLEIPAAWLYEFPTSYPIVLVPTTQTAQGTATVYQHITYATNATGNVISINRTNLLTSEEAALTYEPLLQITPESPTTKFLNGLKEWQPLPDYSAAETLATVTARGSNTAVAVTFGSRDALYELGLSSFANGYMLGAPGEYSHAEGNTTLASGDYSHAEGNSTIALGNASHAEGYLTKANAMYSHASGYNASVWNNDDTAFAWQGTAGQYDEPEYVSHGIGTFNINPAGGLDGFWIGEASMSTILSNYAPATATTVVKDSVHTNRFWTFEGTNVVQYEINPGPTNYTITLSQNFLELVDNTRPTWTTTNWPYTQQLWYGYDTGGPGSEDFFFKYDNEVIQVRWTNSWDTSYPIVLASGLNARGTATIDQHITYVTNATGNVLGPVPTNLVTDAALAAWWASINTNYYTKAQADFANNLHADSYTNLVWRSVISNGWHWLVPYTNTP